jgi:hypothetical protein
MFEKLAKYVFQQPMIEELPKKTVIHSFFTFLVHLTHTKIIYQTFSIVTYSLVDILANTNVSNLVEEH